MDDKPARRPLPGLFVVHGLSVEEARALQSEKKEITEVIELPGVEESCVLRMAPQGEDQTGDWKRLLSLLRDDVTVDPVLLDDEGHLHYPTGGIQIRFVSPPSDDEIEKFARSRNLKALARNRFQPKQVRFEPDPELEQSYVPSLIEELRHSSGVDAAWQEAWAEYRRLQPNP